MSQSSRKIDFTPPKDVADPERVRLGADGGISPKFKVALPPAEIADQEKVRMGADGGISPKFKAVS
jgi:hypothetical protein